MKGMLKEIIGSIMFVLGLAILVILIDKGDNISFWIFILGGSLMFWGLDLFINEKIDRALKITKKEMLEKIRAVQDT